MRYTFFAARVYLAIYLPFLWVGAAFGGDNIFLVGAIIGFCAAIAPRKIAGTGVVLLLMGCLFSLGVFAWFGYIRIDFFSDPYRMHSSAMYGLQMLSLVLVTAEWSRLLIRAQIGSSANAAL
jgi:hypothetical protein